MQFPSDNIVYKFHVDSCYYSKKISTGWAKKLDHFWNFINLTL